MIIIKDKKYTVYCHVCPDGTMYFGCTCQIPENRWGKNGSGYSCRKQPFYEAIQKFGWDNIKHEIISDGLSKENGYALEKELITKYKTTDKKYGWNCADGGMNGNPFAGKTEDEIIEISAKRSKSHLGKKHTEEAKQKMKENHADFSGEKHPKYGRHLSDETKQKISDNHANFSKENHPQYIKRTHEMYEDIKNGIRRKDFIDKYGVSRKIWDSIKYDLQNT